MAVRDVKRIDNSIVAVAQVECSVRVSPTLARLIRKCAEQEENGASAIDALSAAAGVQPGELAALHKQLQHANKDAVQWRDKFVLKRGELEELRISTEDLRNTTAARENETRGELREVDVFLKAAQQSIRTLEAATTAFQIRIAELVTAVEHRERQLAHSLSLSGLDDIQTAAVKALRERLARGDVQFVTLIEAEAMIANLSRPEMRGLNKMLTRHARRVSIIRWLLRVRSSN